MLGKRHIEHARCWGCGDVVDLGYWGFGILGLWNDGDVRCLGCGMFGMWDVWDAGCSRCGMLGM